MRETGLSLLLENRAELGSKARRETDPALLVALERTVVEVHFDDTVHRLDRGSVIVVPAQRRYRVVPKSPTGRLATLLVHRRVRALVCREYRPEVKPDRLAKVLETSLVLVRTRWLDELFHRYVFELDVCEKPHSLAARFLENEITKEIYFLGLESLEQRKRNSVVQEETDLVQRAREWMEQHLFEPLRIEALVRHCGASESTLQRAFRRELGTSPSSYLRERRLDESLLLLQSGQYTVSEVASQVGYGQLAAFTAAFSSRFGASPSSVRPSPAPKVAPHGDPPKRRR